MLGQRLVSVVGATLALCFARFEHQMLAWPNWRVHSPFGVEQTQAIGRRVNSFQHLVIVTWLRVLKGPNWLEGGE